MCMYVALTPRQSGCVYVFAFDLPVCRLLCMCASDSHGVLTPLRLPRRSAIFAAAAATADAAAFLLLPCAPSHNSRSAAATAAGAAAAQDLHRAAQGRSSRSTRSCPQAAELENTLCQNWLNYALYGTNKHTS